MYLLYGKLILTSKISFRNISEYYLDNDEFQKTPDNFPNLGPLTQVSKFFKT